MNLAEQVPTPKYEVNHVMTFQLDRLTDANFKLDIETANCFGAYNIITVRRGFITRFRRHYRNMRVYFGVRESIQHAWTCTWNAGFKL